MYHVAVHHQNHRGGQVGKKENHETDTKKHFPSYPLQQSSLVGSHPYASVDIWLETVICLGVVNIVKLGDNTSENNECSPCTKDPLSQRLATRRISRQSRPVLGVVGIPHRTSKQAKLSNDKCHPETSKDTECFPNIGAQKRLRSGTGC